MFSLPSHIWSFLFPFLCLHFKNLRWRIYFSSVSIENYFSTYYVAFFLSILFCRCLFALPSYLLAMILRFFMFLIRIIAPHTLNDSSIEPSTKGTFYFFRDLDDLFCWSIFSVDLCRKDSTLQWTYSVCSGRSTRTSIYSVLLFLDTGRHKICFSIQDLVWIDLVDPRAKVVNTSKLWNVLSPFQWRRFVCVQLNPKTSVFVIKQLDEIKKEQMFEIREELEKYRRTE